MCRRRSLHLQHFQGLLLGRVSPNVPGIRHCNKQYMLIALCLQTERDPPHCWKS